MPGLAPNLNVGFDRAPGATLETLEASIPGQLEEMVTDLEQLDRVVVDGVEMLHHRGPIEAAGTRYVLEQLVTVDESGRVTIVSFSFPRSSGQQDRDAVVGPVLASGGGGRGGGPPPRGPARGSAGVSANGSPSPSLSGVRSTSPVCSDASTLLCLLGAS